MLTRLRRAADATPPAGEKAEKVGRWGPRAAAAAAGALPVLAFPAPALWWLAWFGLVPWLMLLVRAPSAREAAVRAWFGGGGFLFAMNYWLLPNLGPFLVLVVAALGALWIPWGGCVWWLLARPLTRGRNAAAILLVPAGWVLIEVARSWSSLGGPWGLLGASQWRMPAMVAPASLGGVWLVSYLIVAANTAVAVAVLSTAAWTRLTAGATAAIILVTGPLWYAAEHPPTGDRTFRVAIIQPGVIHGPALRFDQEERMTSRLPAGRFDLVVWGESSVGFDLESRPDLTARLQALSQRLGSDLLVNVDARDATGAIRKTSVLVGPQGILGRYEKMRLVPFGEYIPFRHILGPLTRITRAAPEDRRRGHSLVVMHANGIPFSPLICFESAFPDMSRRVALDGADLIVFQSSTSSFQGSWAPAQHASLAAVRAVETGRPVVHATLTGTSAVFDAQGRRLAWFDTHHRGSVEVAFPLATRTTPFLRYGNWVAVYSATVLIAAATAALVAAGKRRRAQQQPPRRRRDRTSIAGQ
jgi:apolipoprotein N-acyltransferase